MALFPTFALGADRLKNKKFHLWNHWSLSFRNKLSILCTLAILVPGVFLSFYFVDRFSHQQQEYIVAGTENYLNEMLQLVDQQTENLLKLVNDLAQDNNCLLYTSRCV